MDSILEICNKFSKVCERLNFYVSEKEKQMNTINEVILAQANAKKEIELAKHHLEIDRKWINERSQSNLRVKYSLEPKVQEKYEFLGFSYSFFGSKGTKGTKNDKLLPLGLLELSNKLSLFQS